MVEFGLCINAANSIPSADECGALGIGRGDWLRTPIQGSVGLVERALEITPADVSFVVMVNQECEEVGWDWSGLEHACGLLVAMNGRHGGRIRIVVVHNEPDYWGVTPEDVAGLVARASPVLRAGGIKVSMPGLASGGWESYMVRLDALCHADIDYGNLHLYSKFLHDIPRSAGASWQNANQAIRSAKSHIRGLPLICDEAGIKIDDAGGLDEQAWWAMGLPELECDVVCYFAWHDRVGTSTEQGGQAFGARGLNGETKPVWGALQAVFGGPSAPLPSPPPVIPSQPSGPAWALGFEKWHRLEPHIVEGSLEFSEANVWPEVQTIATTNGVGTWVRGDFVWVANRGSNKGKVFRWREGWARSVQVPTP